MKDSISNFFRAHPERPDGVSTFRLYLMRLLYVLNFVLFGLDIWPDLISHAGAWDPLKGVAFSFWGALSLLSGLGIRYPLAMLPLFFMQLSYKAIWLLAVALPQWSVMQSTELTQAMLVGIVLDIVVIPWPYVIANYVLKRGDRWR